MMKNKNIQFSVNPQINKLLETIVGEVTHFTENQMRHIQKLAEIGIALSAERDIHKIFEMIVEEARAFTHADGGTLYIVDEKEKVLKFVILQNDTLNIRLGGTSGKEITLPPVPLEVDGQPNFQNVSSYTALTGEIVNIPDVYEADGFDFTGPRKYDQQTGYRSKSMLVIPMKNHEDEIIGVLQLLNAISPDNGEIVPFNPDDVDLITSLASQAAVALENAQLIQDLQNLFYAFIQSIATAIDEKSPYTGGHIRRVVDLTMMIARAVNQVPEGPLAEIQFSPEELEELRIATWMHDVGKITTPEYVVDKSTKLEGIFDRIELIKLRFDLIQQIIENQFLKKKMALLEKGNSEDEVRSLEEKLREIVATLRLEKEFVTRCNLPDETMSDEKIALLKEIGHKSVEWNGKRIRYLTDEELHYLSIRRGTLTDEERKIIQNHAMMSIKILSQLPFPKKLARVPEYAGGHHEKLDGSGYPLGLKEEQLPLQARIMAIADIFESLTAKDRPYKKPMKLSQALKILQQMKDQKHIDPTIFDIFVRYKIYKRYAEKELSPDQIDS